MTDEMTQDEITAKIAAMKLAAKQALADAKAEQARLTAEAKAKLNQAREAVKLEKARLKAEKLAAKEAARSSEQNGIRRPAKPGACFDAWVVFDTMSHAKGNPVTFAEVKTNSDSDAIKSTTLATQYARWRKYYGISGRLSSEEQKIEKVKRLAEKEAEKKAKAEERAAKQAKKHALNLAKVEATIEKIRAKAQAKLDALNASKN